MNIVITGASKGFGKEIAEAFAGDKQGHTLFLCARNAGRLENTAKNMQARYQRSLIHTMACDVGNKKEVLAFTNWIKEHTDTIDILVNNAGIFLPGAVHEEEEGVLEEMLRVNLMGAYHLSRFLIPIMKKNNQGHIINMCSIASLKAYANGGSYSISKFALAGFTKNLREELKPYNIKVTGIYPGAAYTDSWASSGLPRERFMEARDVAMVVYNLAHLSPSACVEDIIMRPVGGDI